MGKYNEALDYYDKCLKLKHANNLLPLNGKGKCSSVYRFVFKIG